MKSELMKGLIRYVWFSIVLLVFLPDSAYCQSKAIVIAKYLDATGGKEKWLSVRTKIDSSIIISFPKPGLFESNRPPDTVHLVTLYSKPNLQKIYRFGRGVNAIIMCFDGRVLWTRSNGMTKVQSPEESEYFKSTIMLDLVDLLLEEGTQIDYEGVKELDDKQFDVLKIKRDLWIFSSLYYFSQDSGLLYCTIAHEAVSRMRTYSKDYRLVMGILWAHVEETYVGSEITGRSIIKRIELNKPINIREFHP